MAKCKTCGAEIEWVKTPSGRNMPVNLDYTELDPAGHPHDAVVTDEGRVVKGSRLSEDSTLFPTSGKVRGRMPHWATCSDPERHRR